MKVERWEGGVLLLVYAVYLAGIVQQAVERMLHAFVHGSAAVHAPEGAAQQPRGRVGTPLRESKEVERGINERRITALLHSPKLYASV